MTWLNNSWKKGTKKTSFKTKMEKVDNLDR